MDKKVLKHSDCVNFAPVDVAKGICRVSNNSVFTDTDICPNYEAIKKCSNCAHFVNPSQENIGTCLGLEKEAWAYGELTAITCEGYKMK
ncbi:4-hydroxyphenylacetate decarboxylase small subunit [Clostridiaceae bacterium 35-E11]